MKAIYSYLNQIPRRKNLSWLGLILICLCLNCISSEYTPSKEEKIQGYLERGKAYFQAGNFTSYIRAEKQYLNVIELDPTNYEALAQLGYIYYILYENHLWRNQIEDAYETWKKAYNCFKAALKYRSDYGEAYIGLAMVCHCVKQYDEAIELLGRALKLPWANDFLKSKAYYWMGRCYIAQEPPNFTEMTKVFKEYLKILPDGPEADELRQAIQEVERTGQPDRHKTPDETNPKPRPPRRKSAE